MKITKKINQKNVEFEFNALTPRIHKQQFGSDLISGMINLIESINDSNELNEESLKNINLSNLSNIDFAFLEDIAYSCAKTANEMNGEKTPTPNEWFKENYEFSSLTDGLDILQLVTNSINTKKK